VGKAQRAHHFNRDSWWWARRKRAFAHPTTLLIGLTVIARSDSDEAIQTVSAVAFLDCFASLAMTTELPEIGWRNELSSSTLAP
jgi:hypothetical protein